MLLKYCFWYCSYFCTEAPVPGPWRRPQSGGLPAVSQRFVEGLRMVGAPARRSRSICPDADRLCPGLCAGTDPGTQRNLVPHRRLPGLGNCD